PPSPGAPLLPYTTLFRSVNPGVVGSEEGERKAEIGEAGRAVVVRGQGIGRATGGEARHGRDGLCGVVRGVRVVLSGSDRGGVGEDRKSTRLNSSHVSISY